MAGELKTMEDASTMMRETSQCLDNMSANLTVLADFILKLSANQPAENERVVNTKMADMMERFARELRAETHTDPAPLQEDHDPSPMDMEVDPEAVSPESMFHSENQ